jgi:GTP-binding protein
MNPVHRHKNPGEASNFAGPVVAIVGRPNVGKSSLFNRIVGRRQAIVDRVQGVTRDRLYAQAKWGGKSFRLVDTGGLDLSGTSRIAAQIRKQIDYAIKESTLLLWITDVREGILPLDEEIAGLLRQSGKKTLLVVNKVDREKVKEQMTDFFRIGFGEPFAVSAAQGLGMGDLLDAVVDFLPHVPESHDVEVLRVAIVGRPNVGKSSFLNRLLGEERVIVDELPGTTRDAIDTLFEYEGVKYLLIDTAGIRRKGKIKEPVESYSILRTQQAIERCQVSIVITEAQEGILQEDLKILRIVSDEEKACVLVVNKWDLITGVTPSQYEYSIQKRAKFLKDMPVVFTSALTGKNVIEAFRWARQAVKNSETVIPTSRLNRIFTLAQKEHPPKFTGKGQAKFYYWTQVSKSPPLILGFVNNPELVEKSYLNYFENHLRKEFDLRGATLRFEFRKREKEDK